MSCDVTDLDSDTPFADGGGASACSWDSEMSVSTWSRCSTSADPDAPSSRCAPCGGDGGATEPSGGVGAVVVTAGNGASSTNAASTVVAGVGALAEAEAEAEAGVSAGDMADCAGRE